MEKSVNALLDQLHHMLYQIEILMRYNTLTFLAILYFHFEGKKQ